MENVHQKSLRFLLVAGIIHLFSCCQRDLSLLASQDSDANTSTRMLTSGEPVEYPRFMTTEIEQSELLSGATRGDIIPDFSRVGYRWGDQEIPTVPVVLEVEAPQDGSDARQLIQNAIDAVSLMPLVGKHRGAILLKAGRYNVSGELHIDESGVVLRGEGASASAGTTLVATATVQHNFITFGGNSQRTGSPANGRMNIQDAYVPVGQFWVRVTDPDNFNIGDDVIVHRPGSQQWISDISMDLLDNPWLPEEYIIRHERVITHIQGDTLHFDNPIVMALDSAYGGGAVYRYSYEKRLNECGIEDLRLESVFASGTDEEHAWEAVRFDCVEHSWMRRVQSAYFGYGLAAIKIASKNISILDSECLTPRSIVTGGRRYSFEINGSLNLVKNCRSTWGRHDLVTGARQAGPNVFTQSVVEDSHADSGPHHRWNMGTLWDDLQLSGANGGTLFVQDRQNSGTGHGWAGINQVLWNVRARQLIVQQPPVSGYNFSIGSVGALGRPTWINRAEGIWISQGQVVQPQSLYEAQYAWRKSIRPGGVFQVY